MEGLKESWSLTTDVIAANTHSTLILSLLALVFIINSFVKQCRQRKIPSRKEISSRLSDVEHAVFSRKTEISSLQHETEINNENASEIDDMNEETSFLTPSERHAETAETDSVIST